MLDENTEHLTKVIELLAAGDLEEGARYFVDFIAIGPGVWDNGFTQAVRDRFIHNAPAFLDESRDPDQISFDLDSLAGFERPALLTKGTASPVWFAPIVDMLGAAIPHATVQVLESSGHIPQATHPDLYARTLFDWRNGIDT